MNAAERVMPVIDASQARILLDSTRDTRYGPLWTILVTTGLRISEALGLAWGDVTFGGSDAPAPVEARPGLGPRVRAERRVPELARDAAERMQEALA